jgi:hypothetical protein
LYRNNSVLSSLSKITTNIREFAWKPFELHQLSSKPCHSSSNVSIFDVKSLGMCQIGLNSSGFHREIMCFVCQQCVFTRIGTARWGSRFSP